MANYPAALDALSNPTGATNQNDAGFLHSAQHGAANDILEQLEAKLGTTDTPAHDAPLANTVLTSLANGKSGWAAVPSTAFAYATVPAARVFKTTAQSIANGAFVPVTFDGETFDTENIHDNTNPSRLTCRTAGKYRVTASVTWGTGTGSSRQMYLANQLGAGLVEDVRAPAGGGQSTTNAIATTVTLAVGDWLVVNVYQDSGGAISIVTNGNAQPSFAMERIG